MRRICLAPLAAALAAALVASPAAGAGARLPAGSYRMADGRIAVPLRAATPRWYTAEIHRRVLAAADRGLAYDFATGAAVPLAVQFAFIRPGAWMISPNLCTMAFIFGSPGSYSIGTAGHCAKPKKPVVILAAPTLLAAIGKPNVVHDNGVGDDYALVPVASQFQQYVDPNVAVIGGPQGGVYTGEASLTSPVPVKHFGHGLVIGTGGTPRAGVATGTDKGAFYFASPAIFGDSGSPVLVAGSLSAPLGQGFGILTHLIIMVRRLPAFVGGTRLTVVRAPLVDGDLNALP